MDGPDVIPIEVPIGTLSAPAVLGICLGGAILLVSVAAISCFCYRGHQQHRNHKLRGGGGGGGGGSTPINGYRSAFDGQPMPFRKATAVKSPNSTSASAVSGHFLKKSPSPTTLKSPPGSCPFSKSMVASSPLSGTSPSMTSSYEHDASPQLSRKNSRTMTSMTGCHLLEEQHRDTVIRFQLEDEVHDKFHSGSAKMDASPTADVSQEFPDIGPTDSISKLGRLYFKVRHNVEKSILNITVVKCNGLPARDSNVGSSDPYVKLQLLPDKQHKVKTRVMRRTLNPVYDEDFTFYGIGENQLQSLTLHFVVLSFDRYSRDDVIGEVLLPVYEALEDMKNESTAADSKVIDEGTLSRDIAPRSQKMRSHGRGELLVSLCYQPQASRLTAVVLKARNMPRMDMTGLADPYVKIYLVNNGQRVAKKKTHVKKRTLNPVFNESFVFDLPANATNLDDISLEFLVLDWDRVTKNEVIGRLELGQCKSEGTALHHWNEVLSSPRRQIAEWHKLKD